MDVMGCKVISSEYIVGDFFVISIILCSGIFETSIDGNDTCVSMMVSGFCRDVFNQLPLEFAAEADKLLALKLEGSVG